jgi:DNA polymerase-4
MPSSQAVRLCPQLILIPPHFDLYKEESRKVREIMERFTKKIEPLSLDEAYLDVTDCEQFGGSATLIAQEIRRLIQTELNLTASAGIAPNKFIAKIASDWKKPNGQFVVRPQDVDAFVHDLPVEKIFGVGKVTAQKMHDLGLHKCSDIQKYSVAELHQWWGSRAQELYNFSRGIDNREVITEWERKSLTVEETYNKDLQTFEECRKQIPGLYDDFFGRLEKGGYEASIKGMVVKLKFHDFKQTTHEEVLHSVPTIKDFERLLEKAWQRRGEAVRLIGIGVRLGSSGKSSPREEEDSPQMRFAI